MKHETKLGTVENIVTAICFGMGALLVVLAVYTLFAVKSVSANGPYVGTDAFSRQSRIDRPAVAVVAQPYDDSAAPAEARR